MTPGEEARAELLRTLTASIRTDPAHIRAILDDAERTNASQAARRHGVAHKTVYRWLTIRATSGGSWPTDQDVNDWQTAETQRRARRDQTATWAREWRKKVYLNRGPLQQAAVGSTRRLQALYALGWTCPQIAGHTGQKPSAVARIMRGRQATVQPHTAQKIRDAYDALSMTLPVECGGEHRGQVYVHERARRDARRRGYVPPLAWDDETIDDPNAKPHTERQLRTGGKRLHIEDVEWLLELAPRATSTAIGKRLGVSADAIQAACRRADRADLLARLARNAGVAA